MVKSEPPTDPESEEGSPGTDGPADTSVTSDGTGLDSNVAGALAYVFGLLSGVAMLLLESNDEFVRFHALQSIGFTVVIIGAYILMTIIGVLLSIIPFIGDILATLVGLINPLISLGAVVVWAFLIYKAYQGEQFQLPVLGPIAASN